MTLSGRNWVSDMQGLVLIDKPEGMTSFAVVAQMKRAFNEKRAGHTGTLDPMATGVLPVLLGRATRLSSMMLDSDKRYEAELVLGITTDTLDITGNILSTSSLNVTVEQFEKSLNSFRGEILQTPPMYSALKKDGVRLYDLARQGIDVEREARKVTIKKLDFLGVTDEGRFKIDVLCSKGTYIRTLADDIGNKLGCGAALGSLRRTFAGGFDISDCEPLDFIKESPQTYLMSADRCVMHLPCVTVTDNQRNRFLHGGELFLSRLTFLSPVTKGDSVRVYGADGAFLGIGAIDDALMRVQCVIYEGEF